jgi:hypothetical protein
MWLRLEYPSELLRSFGFERKRLYVGKISPVPGPPGVALILEELRLQPRRIGSEHELNGRTSHRDPPLSVALFESVNVATADYSGGHPIVVEEAYQHIALAVGRVAVDLAGVSRNVVGVGLGPGRVDRIDPSRVSGSLIDGLSVLVQPIWVVGAGDEFRVVAVVAPAVRRDAIEDGGAIHKVLHVTA